MFLTKITATQIEDALRYHKLRGINFLGVDFASTIYNIRNFSIQPSVLSR